MIIYVKELSLLPVMHSRQSTTCSLWKSEFLSQNLVCNEYLINGSCYHYFLVIYDYTYFTSFSNTTILTSLFRIRQWVEDFFMLL